MRIVVVGGGPAGLYFSILMKRLDPAHEITVYERNPADATFGFGVVFSDETLAVFEEADPPTYAQITEAFARWADIDIHYRDEVITSSGHGFAALSRKRLLEILQRRAAALGVDMRYRAEAPPVGELRAAADLVVAADGANSRVRAALATHFEPQLDTRRCKYMWLGTDLVLDAFKFFVLETDHGVFQVHAYPYDAAMSTFIVETNEATWRRAGLDTDRPLAPGESDLDSVAYLQRLFADALDDRQLVANNSRWLTFTTVRNRRWHAGNVVLVGDAAHTAHFSIGSGTKLAMEDAVELAWALRDPQIQVETALAAYEAERRPTVESTQRAAQASLEWFEGIGRYVGQPPLQFAFNLLTRSRRVTYENLRLRDPGFVARVDREFSPRKPRPPMFHSFRLRGLELPNRVVVSPMDMYSAVDGAIGDFHLVHLGARGIGGAGLVMSEMLCVSAHGRISPACAGLYRDAHVDGWRRIVEFVHRHGHARIGAQLGHSGRKGSTKVMWEGEDQPLPDGNWPLIAPSPLQYLPVSQVPREMTRADMDAVRDEFVAATERAEAAGFDLLELHMAHGYLLSSFLSPLTNHRTDGYGGTLEGRARFPLEVLAACRAAWPDHKPISVRISATDWHDRGFDGDQAVELAGLLGRYGCDVVHVSTGQVVPDQRPEYGRSYQTPYAARIRHEAGMPTIAVGAISSYDDVNTIVLAGWADLCALARPHLYDPQWTLHAASDQEWEGLEWIPQYRSGRRKPPTGRGDGQRRRPPRLFGDGERRDGWARRWRPDRAAARAG
jgi:anthraniloyl-CoA monooxygenase